MVVVGICLLSLLIALPGFINKAGYSFYKGLIPGYNLYLFFTLLEFSPILLGLLGLGMIFCLIELLLQPFYLFCCRLWLVTLMEEENFLVC